MSEEAQTPLETGWLAETPIEDSILRRFIHNQADINGALATAGGGRTGRSTGVFLSDAAIPVAYMNQAILTRPLTGDDDPVLDAIDKFFAAGTSPATILSIWPTPDLSGRGWSLAGHPAVVLRAPGPVDYEPPADVEVRVAATTEDFAAAERVAVEGYPLPEAAGLAEGSVLPPGLADAGVVVRLGLLDGEPVAVGNAYAGHGLVNLCLGATLPAARRRGVWEALVWARVNEAPELPAIAYTSDDSRPGFISRGFLPVTRFTLWIRPS